MEAITKPIAEFAHWATHPKSKYVFKLDEGSIDDANLLGNRGATLCDMKRNELPIPASLIITTEACQVFASNDKRRIDAVIDELNRNVKTLEKECGQSFGLESDPKANPLLLSVRCGFPFKIPGIGSTVLGLGLNDASLKKLKDWSNDESFALRTYILFLETFGEVVYGIKRSKFFDITNKFRRDRGVPDIRHLPAPMLEKIIGEMKLLVSIPENPWEQLRMVIESLFRNWDCKEALYYREQNNIPSDYGVSIVMQSMIFGNLNENSGSGIVFSRDPVTGVNGIHGEYLYHAPGIDVSDGTHIVTSLDLLKRQHPSVYDKLHAFSVLLETRYRDMQSLEFTVQDGQLYILAAEPGRRSAIASIVIAVNMVKEKLLTEREALLRVNPSQLSNFHFKTSDPTEMQQQVVLGFGISTVAGIVSGDIAFSSLDAKLWTEQGRKVILCRSDTLVDDLDGVRCSAGVLTMHGGYGSHAASTAMDLGIPLIVGAARSGMKIDFVNQVLICKGGVNVRKGETITLDGTTGRVFLGEIASIDAATSHEYRQLLEWADKFKRMEICALTKGISDIESSLYRGADGIGQLFLDEMCRNEAIADAMRFVLMSKSGTDKIKYRMMLENLIGKEFTKVFGAVRGHHIGIRFLGPCACSLVCMDETELVKFAFRNGMSREEVHNTLENFSCKCSDYGCQGLQSSVCLPVSSTVDNIDGTKRATVEMDDITIDRIYASSLGCLCLGCNILAHTELTDAFVTGILDAAYLMQSKAPGSIGCVHFVFPSQCSPHEVDLIVPVVNEAYAKFTAKSKFEIRYKIEANFESPRACIRIDKFLANHDVDCVAFGAERLTELVFGVHRNVTKANANNNLQSRVWSSDPFHSIDRAGVGYLIDMAVRKCRAVDKDVVIGVYGEQCGAPESVRFLDGLGVDRIMVPMQLIPSAKVAAAQATIAESMRRVEDFDRFLETMPIL